MRAAIHFLAIIFIAISVKTPAQEFINSHVRIFKETGATISSTENEYAIVKLNAQTNQFNVDLCVLLTNPGKQDTIAEISQQLSLNFTGRFPIDDLDFFDLSGKEGKIYTIIGDLTINDIVKSYTKMNFALHRSTFPGNYTRDIRSYPYHISFLMEINPADFCLDNCPKTILVEVKDGIINKLNNGNKKIECEVVR